MLSICQQDTEGDKDSGNSAIPQTSVNQEMARFVSALWLHMTFFTYSIISLEILRSYSLNSYKVLFYLMHTYDKLV